MAKINNNIYKRLLLQAEEAKIQGMEKLASGVFNAIGPIPEEEKVSYSYSELNEDVYKGLWKLASNIIRYYDVNSADIQKMDETIESLASKFIENLEASLEVSSVVVGPFEPKLPGESK